MHDSQGSDSNANPSGFDAERCVPALGLESSSLHSVALGIPESGCQAQTSGSAGTQSVRRAWEKWQQIPNAVAEHGGTSPTAFGDSL